MTVAIKRREIRSGPGSIGVGHSLASSDPPGRLAVAEAGDSLEKDRRSIGRPAVGSWIWTEAQRGEKEAGRIAVDWWARLLVPDPVRPAVPLARFLRGACMVDEVPRGSPVGGSSVSKARGAGVIFLRQAQTDSLALSLDGVTGGAAFITHIHARGVGARIRQSARHSQKQQNPKQRAPGLWEARDGAHLFDVVDMCADGAPDPRK